ncbi:sodium:solute symporter family protein [Pelotomaculum isophthalicicum JI]|uniref:Sodium:solute symporter family protein n=1 Tax=Pelotomaculum isophthalicicum JI TaxID=947010 RepID=A0A9X4H3D3_9FIRM|nr:sodium:solute symporter family protein [Pelotomaculum isophthalicicum]MDF9407938.1 sodium:solute symporter family protein [Pelotomaculum isophthalicicum JI]
MYGLTYSHIISIVLTLTFVSLVGIYAGRQVSGAADFTVSGRKAGVILIIGTITGTLVGGASTVGTAELAFRYGMSAWWFTLGAGAGCFLLALLLAKPLRESKLETIPQFLVMNYGPAAGPIASIFSSTGIFLNIIAQILAAIALISPIFQLSSINAALIAIVLVICYVYFGGVMSTGIVGIVKLVILYSSLIVTGLLAYTKVGGAAGIINSFPPFPWLSFFGRGFSTDIAAGFSLIVGVMSTQTYLQAMFSGKDVKTSKLGAICSGVLVLPSGLAGLLVGMYMKLNYPDMIASEALPVFVINFLPPWLGGIVLAVLLVAVIGTAAGLTLGISTMFTRDIYQKYINTQADDRRMLMISRVVLIAVIGLTILFVTGNLKSMILQWSFLSMGLRGACIFLPLLGAVFFKNLVSPIGGILALAVGPMADLAWKLAVPGGIDPLYAGLLASFIVLLICSVMFPASRYPKTN